MVVFGYGDFYLSHAKDLRSNQLLRTKVNCTLCYFCFKNMEKDKNANIFGTNIILSLRQAAC